MDINSVNRDKWTYSTLSSIQRPGNNSDQSPVPVRSTSTCLEPDNMEIEEEKHESEFIPSQDTNRYIDAIYWTGQCKVESSYFRWRRLIKDPTVVESMNKLEKRTWKSFVLVIQNFLGNHNSENYFQLVIDVLSNFKHLGCNMSIKLHYLHSHLDRFPENLGDYSEEHGEGFIRIFAQWKNVTYQGRWVGHTYYIMADYCWNLYRDVIQAQYSRKSYKNHS